MEIKDATKTARYKDDNNRRPGGKTERNREDNNRLLMISLRVLYGSRAILMETHGAVLRSKLSHLKDMDAYAFIVFTKG
jgi:hypothetical protein